jgi:DNA-directed RNA polymerase subunit RPC12/RpoP
MAVHAHDDTKPLECETCGKRFLTNSALAGHIKTHIHPDTLYDCPICLQEFEQVSSLKEHVYIHKEGGQFTCPLKHKVIDHISVGSDLYFYSFVKTEMLHFFEQNFEPFENLDLQVVASFLLCYFRNYCPSAVDNYLMIFDRDWVY